MNRTSQILDVAERRMRESGYHAVSYRDIADEMGIKSASLHYHFRKKSDLGEALVRRYTERFFARLAEATDTGASANAQLEAFIDLYRLALGDEYRVCLCVMLGSESPGLPDPVIDNVGVFFDRSVAWLERTLGQTGSDDPHAGACAILAKLQGAMILSSVWQNDTAFDAVRRDILETDPA